MISYINHPETEDGKAHTDILLNGEYIGYFIQTDVITAFFELNTEMYAGEFNNTKQLTKRINQLNN